MKDCNGIELQVGDTVCYIGSGGLIKGKIVGTVRRSRVGYRYDYSLPGRVPCTIETDRVEVERPGYGGNYNVRVGLTQPGNVVKVSA